MAEQLTVQMIKDAVEKANNIKRKRPSFCTACVKNPCGVNVRYKCPFKKCAAPEFYPFPWEVQNR